MGKVKSNAEPSMAQPALSDLIFSPQANHNFSRILGDLKRSNLSITNRLQSIKQDSIFVSRVSSYYGLPLVANERCGSWYVDPALKAVSAYFKSTDGHAGQWSFSTRRLNLHLLDLVGARGGCVIVDSTRRGKRMPDALSKTVPVWCCVLNRVLFPEEARWHALYVPPGAVSESEKSLIEERIPGFVEAFGRLAIDVPPLREKLGKPIRPIWRTQDDGILEAEEEQVEEDGREGKQIFGEFHAIVCCTSSRRVGGTEMSEGGYIQGAADDTENWAHGLTAPIFWEHADELLATPESDLPGLIERLVANTGPHGAGEGSVQQLTPVLCVSALPLQQVSSHRTCVVKLVSQTTEKETWVKSKKEMEVGVGKAKTAGRNLRYSLPSICEFAKEFLESDAASSKEDHLKPQIIVACETGKDLSVGVALALDCWCFDDNGRLRQKGENVSFTKTAIRVRLGRIMTAMPEANPSRTTLQSVNSFLMDWRK